MRRTATKAGRLELQNYEFTTLINNGYSRENYGDLMIFTMTDKDSTWLKIFRGTASKEVIYKRYRTEAQAVEAIKNAKASHDRHKTYKADLKANPKKSSSANCAAAIREELKKEFPTVKFSVKSSNFSGGDSVRVHWENGPTTDEVEVFTRKYQYGRFDGMTDMYEYTNSIENLPQSKYVSTSREISEEVKNVVREAVKNLFNFSEMSEWEEEREINSYTYKIINKNSIPVGATVTGIETMQEGVFFEDRHPLTFLIPETTQAEPQEATIFEEIEVKAGEVSIVDYSEKSIAVIGDTKPIKDQLKELGGKFNFRLSCGAGWIFQKSKLEEVQKLLQGEEPTADEPTTLKDEVEETINFLADLDVKIYGEVSESVRECARVQEVEIYQDKAEQTQLTFFL
jgi:hypothetical protein